MPAQTTGNMGKNYVAVIKLDREGRTWKNLLDAAVNFERRLFVVDAVRLDFSCFGRAAIPSSDNILLMYLAAAATKRSTPRLGLGFKTVPRDGIA